MTMKVTFILFNFALSSRPLRSEAFSINSQLKRLPVLIFPNRATTFLIESNRKPCSRFTWNALTRLASEPGSTNETESSSQEINSSEPLKETSSNEEILDPIFILPSLTLVGLALLAAMVIFTNLSRPNSGLDVDLYMAIDGTLNSNSMGGGMGSQDESIIALPSLSPAEKLVGALFGPPTPR